VQPKNKIEEVLKGLTDKDIKLSIGGLFADYSISPGDVSAMGLKSEEIIQHLQDALRDRTESVELNNGFINIRLKSSEYLEELKKIDLSEDYFKVPEAEKKTIVFDYSSPNIAKPFSVGHLRSTIIGQANLNIHKLLGFKTIGINHIGDWGTQFGKLIYAIKTWGNEEEIAKNPVSELNALYIKFHTEAEKDDELNDRAREWFRKLETGDEEARKIWEQCVKWSTVEFDRIYEILNVRIDEVKSESFYEDKLQSVIDELKENKLLKESLGAQIVELEDMPPALIQKKDEATLYLTRDLAALKYRIENYNPDEIIYHVGNDQGLHFKQLFAVADKLGWTKKVKLTFAGHGLMRLEEGKMSTRAGRVILLNDLIQEAENRASKIIEEKNPDLKNKTEVAQKIGISAIKYADLSTNRKSDVVFSFDKMLSLKGNSGPYLQYTYARASSVLRKLKEKHGDIKTVPYLSKQGIDLARQIIFARNKIICAATLSNPNVVCDLAFKVAEDFNNFYEKQKIISDNSEESSKNAYLVSIAKDLMGTIFDLLAIERLDEI